ncbi:MULTISPECIES: SHOCT domain-containing protein [unclassified Haloarcula]|uniref:SHOCT domain-containing protein n=1 Tax=Haloarcula TaxID=2237 RepID=UPI000EF16456|nr:MULTISPECIES: SHOCT domain-containing protein [unclassified Haloarcula]RLM36479.1 SHOCT domain-containing protein [Haloarcula sp. Atlit-120R]RLM83451.1 SHOCT domain-containing protein [Haloarcula sp. Atlit-7R]
MTDWSPLGRARANATELASLGVTGFWLVALFTGQEWWLAALLVGYVVVVPLTELLYGEPDEAEEDIEGADSAPSSDASDESPLERLRRRYAEGELTDEQFERKLGRLLETETLEGVEDATRDESEREFERN